MSNNKSLESEYVGYNQYSAMVRYLLQLGRDNRPDNNLFIDAYTQLEPFDNGEYAFTIADSLRSLFGMDRLSEEVYQSIVGFDKSILIEKLKLAFSKLSGDTAIGNLKISSGLNVLEANGFPTMYLFHGTAFTVKLIQNLDETIYANPLTQNRVYLTQSSGIATARFNPFTDQLPYLIAVPLVEICRTLENQPDLGNVGELNLDSFSIPTIRFDFQRTSNRDLSRILARSKVFAHPRARS